LFDNVINNLDDFNWDMNNLFDFLNSWDFNNFFNNLLDWNNLWNLNNLFNDLFNNLFNFNDLRNNSEDLENIINADDSHDFLIDHSDDSFVNFKNGSSSNSDLFEFLKQGLNQNSQVE